MATPENPGDNAGSDDKPSVGAQAAQDVASSAKGVITSTAAGAATGGGIPGAVVGAAKGIGTAALKTKTGRRAIGVIIGIFLVIVILIVTLVAMIIVPPGQGAAMSMQASYASESHEVALESIEDDGALDQIQGAAAATSVRWEILAAIWKTQQDKSLPGGAGPFGIDLDAAKGRISKKDAENTELAATFVATRVSEESADTLHRLKEFSLDAGYTMAEEGSSYTRLPIATEDAEELRAEIKEAYIGALSEIPVVGIKDDAEHVYDLAQAWAVGEQGSSDLCLDTSGDVAMGGTTSADLNASQLKYAQFIINRVADRKMPERAAIVALATAMQESTLRMYWNPKVPGSRELTDDVEAKGHDGYSVGLFQQQVHLSLYSWGTVNDAMNPNKSTDMFLDRLLTIPLWEKLPISQAAQSVQVSAFPDAYANWTPLAKQLVADLKPTAAGGGYENSHGDKDDAKEDKGNKDEAKSDGQGEHLTINTDLTPDAIAVETAMRDRYGKHISTLGDYRAGDGDHGQRRAIDIMIKDYKAESGIAGGTAIADFLIANTVELGVEYIIWRDRIWLGPSQGWGPYSKGKHGQQYADNWNDTTLHNNHVHVTVYGAHGTGGDYRYVSPDGSSDRCGGGISTGDGEAITKGDDYPYKNPGVIGFPATDPWGMFTRECVSFVAWRLNQLMGSKEGGPPLFTAANMAMAGDANAEAWSKNLAKKGYVTDMTPKAGAVAWFAGNVTKGDLTTGSAGHVAIVKQVNGDGTVVVEQYNVVPYTYSVMTIDAQAVSGYIHVADVKSSDKDKDKDKKDAKPAKKK